MLLENKEARKDLIKLLIYLNKCLEVKNKRTALAFDLYYTQNKFIVDKFIKKHNLPPFNKSTYAFLLSEIKKLIETIKFLLQQNDNVFPSLVLQLIDNNSMFGEYYEIYKKHEKNLV